MRTQRFSSKIICHPGMLGMVLMFLVLLGCEDRERQPDQSDVGGDNPVVDSGDASDTMDLVEEEMGPEKICEPNQVIGCRDENTPSVDRCNPAGTAIEAGRCQGVQVCREGECVPVSCIPGSRRCSGTDQPQVCDQEGEMFQDDAACAEGFRCAPSQRGP